MKKFIMIVFFFLVIIVFIGFNYLLWERENRAKDIKSLQDINTSNSITISALNRQLENLDNNLKIKEDNINKLNEEILALKKDLEKLNQDFARSNKAITHKNDVIEYLLKNTQLGIIEMPIKEWAEYINAGDYESTYRTWYVSKEDIKESIAEFGSKYRDVVDGIKIQSIAIYDQDIEKQYGTEALQEGDVFFLVELDVKLVEGRGEGNSLFEEGLNRKIFALRYNSTEDVWHISGIMEIK
ncbi:MAG: hypothetical protein GX754_10865 [Clostridiaceae bacterium]|nr:hypothetical protein [Clostridiaceae bacterium]